MRHAALSLVAIALLAGCVQVSLRVVQKVPVQQPGKGAEGPGKGAEGPEIEDPLG